MNGREEDGRLQSDTAQYGDEQRPTDLPTFLDLWWDHRKSLRELIEGLARDVCAMREELRAQQDGQLPNGGITLGELKELIMTLQVDVQNMVDQIARNTSIEESSALALAGLTAKITQLDARIAELVALGSSISAEDIAALKAGSAALVTSAEHLQAATPANTGGAPVTIAPVDPASLPPIPPADPGPAGARGGRRF